MNTRKIIGANTINYLLEKSRVTSLGEDERNYNIFYFLCKGATKEDLLKYYLINDKEEFCNLYMFNIINKSKC